MAQKFETVEKIPEDEKKLVESYRAARLRAGKRPAVLTIYITSDGIMQVWEGYPKGSGR